MRKNVLVLLIVALVLTGCTSYEGDLGDVYYFIGQGEKWDAELRANTVATVASEGKIPVEMTLSVNYRGDPHDLESGGKLYFEAAWKYREDEQSSMIDTSNEIRVVSSYHGVNCVLGEGDSRKKDVFVVSYVDPDFHPISELIEVTAKVSWDNEEESFLLERKS